jgi:Ca2+-binding EF-hand superfamily protein
MDSALCSLIKLYKPSTSMPTRTFTYASTACKVVFATFGKDKKIDTKDLRGMMSRIQVQGEDVIDAIVEDVAATNCGNKEARLDFQRFCNLTVTWKSLRDALCHAFAAYHHVFGIFNNDHSGMIDKNELKDMLKQIGLKNNEAKDLICCRRKL